MKNNHRIFAALLALVALFSSCGGEQRKYVIGVSQCSDDSWRTKLQQELELSTYFNDEVQLVLCSANDDVERQCRQIDSLVGLNVDLLIVSPQQLDNISSTIAHATDKGIPVILFDRKSNVKNYTAYMGADNYRIGRMLGDYAASLLGGQGEVVEIAGEHGSSPAIERHNGFADAAPKLRRHFAQRLVDMPGERAQALCRNERVAGRAVFLEINGYVLRRVGMLHRPDDLRIAEHKAAAAQTLAALFLKLGVAYIPVLAYHSVARRNVQHSGRDDLLAVQKLSVLAQREKVQKHLQVHAVQHVREVKFLAPCFVIDNAQIQLAIVQPAVHPVGNAGEHELILALAKLKRRKLRRVGKVKLKRQRLKIAAAQLVGKIEHYPMYAAGQAAEKIFKALAFIAKIVKLARDVFVDVFIAQPRNGLVVNALVAAH